MYNLPVLLVILNTFLTVLGLDLNIVSDAPIVRGATVHFTATLSDGGDKVSDSYDFVWEDNAFPSHTRKASVTGGVDTWNVTYDKSVYPPGKYEIQVVVYKYEFFIKTSSRLYFDITELLNGAMHLRQGNVTRDIFVASNVKVAHEIKLHEGDADFLANATSITTFWLIDCVNLGPYKGLSFEHTYTDSKDHTVDALIVANFDPLTTPAPSTSTTTSTTPAPNITTTTLKPNVTQVTSNVTEVIPLPSTAIPKVVENLSVKQLSKRSVAVNNTLLANSSTANVSIPPFVCGSKQPPQKGNIYGHFQAKIKVRAPISNITIQNLKWIHRGDMINITVKCEGSKTFNYCYSLYKGEYNVTGNEKCAILYQTEVCEIPIKRFFFAHGDWTFVIIIENDLGKVIKPVTINVFETKKQAQLSVIVVPVAFSLVAVVLIVFGIAYFIQNRSRFVVEVADFNFGPQTSDLEYKTFGERLRDSVSNMFTRVPSPTPSTSEVPVWPPNKTYGSMT